MSYPRVAWMEQGISRHELPIENCSIAILKHQASRTSLNLCVLLRHSWTTSSIQLNYIRYNYAVSHRLQCCGMRPNGSPPAHLCTLGCRGFKSPPIPCHVSSLSNGQKCSRHVKPLQLMVIACKRKRYRPQAARQIVARFPRLQRHAMFPNKQPEKECHGKTDSSMCLLSQIPTCSTPSQILHYPKLFSVSCYILLPSATGTLLGILTGDLENLSDGTPLLVKPHQAAFQSTRPADCESTHVQTANLWWHDLQRNDQKKSAIPSTTVNSRRTAAIGSDKPGWKEKANSRACDAVPILPIPPPPPLWRLLGAEAEQQGTLPHLYCHRPTAMVIEEKYTLTTTEAFTWPHALLPQHQSSCSK